MSLPGRWLHRAAARICTARTIERVIDPAIADLQAEYREALRTHGQWRAAWVRVTGYAAFWEAASLHAVQAAPAVVWGELTAEAPELARTIAWSLIVFLPLTLLLSALPMLSLHTRFGLHTALLLMPQAIPISIPIALPVGIAWARHGRDMTARRVRAVLLLATVAALLALAAMLAIPDANQAFRVTVAEKLELRGITKYSLPRGMNELSLSDLARRAREYETAGRSDAARGVKQTYHVRLALPAATLVLSVFALGLCAAVRGRAGRVAAIAGAVQFYWLLLALTKADARLPAAVSIWLPNLAFAPIALMLCRIGARRAASAHVRR